MRTAMLISLVRPIGPIIVGISLGFTLSLLSITWVDETCDSERVRATEEMLFVPPGSLKGARKPSSISTGTTENGNTEEDLEPRIVPYNQPAQQGPQKKVFRAKYASTELGIRERLFVVVLTSEASLSTLAVAVNRTLRRHVDDHLVFLTDASGRRIPHGMPVFAHGDERPASTMFQAMHYLLEHRSTDYDWFYVLWDHTYVQPDRLKALVGHLSAGLSLYMGRPRGVGSSGDAQERYCVGSSGFLLSRALLLKLQPLLDQCRTAIGSAGPDEWLGRCIIDHTGVSCVDEHEGLRYNSFEMEQPVELNSEENPGLQEALSVHPVRSPEQMYSLHRYFTERELQETYKEIEKLQVEIRNISPITADGNGSASWPIGVPPPFQPKSRFEVLRWDYFNEEEIFSCADGAPCCRLSGADREDVADVVQTAVRELSEKYAPTVRLTAPQLVNGYRRFDPTRGMEYTLDLRFQALTEAGGGRSLSRRVQMVRPLSQVEIIPMPYVTEATRVHLLVPAASGERAAALRFLERPGVFEPALNVALTFLFLYEPDEAQQAGGAGDVFAEVKSAVAEHERLHPGVTVPWISMRTEGPGILRVLDVASRKHPADTLFLLATVDTVINGDVLNRCRMNAIAGWQVFFPVHFQAFDPRVTSPHQPPPAAPDLVREVGHFDRHAFSEACFYNTDYTASRARMAAEGRDDDAVEELLEGMDAYDVFLRYSHLHVFRAVEPALRQHHRGCDCDARLGEGDFQRCLRSSRESIGSRAQLAALLFGQELPRST